MKRPKSVVSLSKHNDVISPLASFHSNPDLAQSMLKYKIELSKDPLESSLNRTEMDTAQTQVCISDCKNIVKYTPEILKVPKTTKNKDYEGNITFNEDSRAALPLHKRRAQYRSLISRLNIKSK
jgi:hypothetical protein